MKNKRDAGELTPGSLYRITDYQCTTTQENTKSAGHQFDIVLLALSEDKLAEEGWAMHHANDTYFANSNLSAWKVWYCLDNDTSRFAWADGGDTQTITTDSIIFTRNPDIDRDGKFGWYNSNEDSARWTDYFAPKIGDQCYEEDMDALILATNITAISGFGRGVIYRLIDEFNNDIKYDFKNIQFKRKITNGQYDDVNGTETWCYTLNVWYNNVCQDASIVGNTLLNDEGYITGVYDNKFGHVTAHNLFIKGINTFSFALGGNVVLSFIDDEYYYGIHSNTIGDSFYFNTIGSNFYSNTIGSGFYYNTILNDFNSNIIGNDFSGNKIGNEFYYNNIGNSCSSNVIGNEVHDNTIGNCFNGRTISNNTYYKNYGSNGVELATKNDLN